MADLCTEHSCDGQMHFTAVWDDDTQRNVPVDYRCPKARAAERDR